MDIVINPWAVLLAALSTFIIGGLWYSLLFAKPWQRAAGITDQLRSGTARVFIGSFLLAVVMAVSLAAFIGESGLGFGLDGRHHRGDAGRLTTRLHPVCSPAAPR